MKRYHFDGAEYVLATDHDDAIRVMIEDYERVSDAVIALGKQCQELKAKLHEAEMELFVCRENARIQLERRAWRESDARNMPE